MFSQRMPIIRLNNGRPTLLREDVNELRSTIDTILGRSTPNSNDMTIVQVLMDNLTEIDASNGRTSLLWYVFASLIDPDRPRDECLTREAMIVFICG